MAIPNSDNSRRENRTERFQVKLRPTLARLVEESAEHEGVSETTFAERALKKEASKIPILGEIACGGLAEVDEEKIEGWVNVGDLFKTQKGDFLLRARGYSMVEGRIGDGDLVLIRPSNSCNSGEIAAVLIDTPVGTTATLKKVEFSANSPIVRLIPMSADHEVIEIDTSDKDKKFRICGVKRGIIRVN